MLRKYTYIFALFSLLGFTAGCSDDLETGQAASNGKGLSLQIAIDNNEENTSSRTTLESFDAKNNVQKVQIYIFEGTGDEATYLDSEPVEWNENAQKANRTQHTLKYASLRNGREYTLLGVGMDKESKETYDVTLGTKLKDAYAKLKSGKGKVDIAQSEFFTGTVSFEFRGENTNLESLTLRRRVAGVMLYVKDIPQTINEKRVTKIKLELGQPQKSSVMLQRDFTDLEWEEPEGQEPMGDDSKILTEIDLTNTEEFRYDATKDCYQNVDGTGTAYRGVYMLPLNASDDANTKTFTVKLYGKSENGDGSLKDDETQLREFPVRNNSEEGATNFDIRSNYIYCIGKKAEGMDEPISLGDDVILLEVQNWIPIKHEADLGATRVQALFDDTENEIHNCINHEFDITILPPSILVRDQLISVKLFVDNSLTEGLNNAGVPTKINGDDGLTDKEKGLYSNWLYIFDHEDGDSQYYETSKDLTDQVKAGNKSKISLFMNDYARPRKTWGWTDDKEYTPEGIEYIDKDTRSVNLVLETKFYWDTDKDNEDEEVTRYDYLKIEQYNTITVYYNPQNGEDKYTYCGFSREDLAGKYMWGFENDGNGVVYYDAVGIRDELFYNGAANLKGLACGTTTRFEELFVESAMGIAQNEGIFNRVTATMPYKIEQGKDIRTEYNQIHNRDYTPTCWYLPASYELQGLMVLASNKKVETSLKTTEENFYWSSTAGDVGDKDAWAYCLGPVNSSLLYLSNKQSREESASNQFNIRQARRFPEEYEYAW